MYTLKKGDKVEIQSRDGTWYRITYLGKPGYVYSRHLISESRYDAQSPRNTYALIGTALVIAFVIARSIRDKRLLESVTESTRGTSSERDLVMKLLRYGIPAQSIFHDLYLETHKGAFSQIDLAVVAPVGLIVIEVKDYGGWIFGNGNQPQWTQVLNYGRNKYRFYNPILQNSRHIVELKKQIVRVGKIPFYSIVVFYGDCVLKEVSFVPEETFLVKSARILEVMDIILGDNEPLKDDHESEIREILKKAVANGTIPANRIQHMENIGNMLGKHRIFD